MARTFAYRRSLVSILTLATIALAGCSSSDSSSKQAAPSTVTSAVTMTTVVTPESSADTSAEVSAEVSESSEPASPSESSTSDNAPVPSAYPGAGGPRPANARPISTVKGDPYIEVAVFEMPSDNIGCDLSDSYAGCGVSSYAREGTMGSSVAGNHWWVDLESGAVLPKNDVAAYMPKAFGGDDNVISEVVPYGDIVYYGPWTCASEEAGLTCWNTDTGRGAFINRAGTQFF